MRVSHRATPNHSGPAGTRGSVSKKAGDAEGTGLGDWPKGEGPALHEGVVRGRR